MEAQLMASRNPVEKRLRALQELAAYYRRQLDQPTKRVFDHESSLAAHANRFIDVAMTERDRQQCRQMIADCEAEISRVTRKPR